MGHQGGRPSSGAVEGAAPASEVTLWWAVRLRTVPPSDSVLSEFPFQRRQLSGLGMLPLPLGPLPCSLRVGGRQADTRVFGLDLALGLCCDCDQMMRTLCSS